MNSRYRPHRGPLHKGPKHSRNGKPTPPLTPEQKKINAARAKKRWIKAHPEAARKYNHDYWTKNRETINRKRRLKYENQRA